MYRLKTVGTYQTGFSLVELMISMVIGLFLMTGVFTVFVNSRHSQDLIQDQVNMLDEARFALETISFDLRHAGIYGRVTEAVDLVTTAVPAGPGIADTTCSDWAMRVADPVYAFNDAISDASFDMTDCALARTSGDIIEMRYTLGTVVAEADVVDGLTYAKSNTSSSVFFVADDSVTTEIPDDTTVPNGVVYQYVAHAYYISNFTETAGDNRPSLHRVSLGPKLGSNTTLDDEVLLTGVEQLQVMLGLDTDNDGTVNRYVAPAPTIAWNQVRSAQIWLVIKSNDLEPDLDTAVTYNIAGGSVTTLTDGYRREMMKTVVSLRNQKPSF